MTAEFGVLYDDAPTPGDDEPPANPQPVTDLETATTFLTIHPNALAIVVRDITEGVWRNHEEPTA